MVLNPQVSTYARDRMAFVAIGGRGWFVGRELVASPMRHSLSSLH
jgi:hypothetical protein